MNEKSMIRFPGGSQIVVGDALEVLKGIPGEVFRCCITSPPYWGVRDYGFAEQLGAEESIEDYLTGLRAVLKEVRRVLTVDGTLWLNIGDVYTSGNRTWRATDRKNPAREMSYRPPTPEGLKPKDLVGLPWRLAFALQEDGWYLRSDIIWYKPNSQPESVKDRPTQAHEYVFLLSKAEKYLYNYEASLEPTSDGRSARNSRSMWSIPTEPNGVGHFAVFPPALVRKCVVIGSDPGDYVLDPFFGSGTVGLVCVRESRKFVGIEIKRDYAELASQRISGETARFQLT